MPVCLCVCVCNRWQRKEKAGTSRVVSVVCHRDPDCRLGRRVSFLVQTTNVTLSTYSVDTRQHLPAGLCTTAQKISVADRIGPSTQLSVDWISAPLLSYAVCDRALYPQVVLDWI